MKAKKLFKVIIIMLSLVLISYVGICAYLVINVNHYRALSCNKTEYEPNDFVDNYNYMRLCPCYRLFYDLETGLTKNLQDDIEYNERAYFLFPYFSFSKRCFAIHGNYDYTVGATNTFTGASGEFYVYFSISSSGFCISSITYGV